MTIRVTILKAGAANVYGQAYAIGSTQTVGDDYGRDLIQQGLASDTDGILSSPPRGGPVAAGISAARDFTWTQHIAIPTGSYDGEVRRILSGAGNNIPFDLVWSLSALAWNPRNGTQTYYIGDVVTVTNSDGLQTLTVPTVAHPANFWRSGLGLMAEAFAETSIAATARTCQLTIGTEDFVVLPTAANRRVAGRWGFMASGASAGWVLTKRDTNEFDMPNQANTNVQALTQAWSSALSLTGSISFTTAANAATATLRRFRLNLVQA